ncbi:tetratricopeptide repeat-containing sensor histidine kinase [Sphingobacterium sp. JUb56]|uniref:tetratricopeptide repeat-containing sensor histidine kinase n=1 Tax=Sphingobacterium sp. JUb56 TaxID=2587145 RepID=UPI0016130275|nr:tetratricopeptide repeat-containing sensor histidine kinase [Sphingobacterium sp. JUb56]MBB2951597.1 signal transduction histidine kinase [Sphingobacterium sp. JUb56]
MYKILIFCLLLLSFTVSCTDVKHKEAEKILNENEYYDKAFFLWENGRSDSTFYYFNKAKEKYLQYKNSVYVARCLIYMATIQYDSGDFFGAQETAVEAIKYLDPKDKNQQAILSHTYNTIANATDEMQQFDQAIPYYRLAIQYSIDHDNILLYKNNLAVCLRNVKRYDESIKLYDDILTKTPKGTTAYAKFLNNLAKTKWASSHSYNPILVYHIALNIRLKENDLWGQNSSYATLSKYYEGRDMDSSIYYLSKQYEIAKKIKSADDQLNALRGLVQMNPIYSERYLSTYLSLNDSLQTARTAAKNQFALIRYESEKSKAQNLVLEKENEKKESHLVIQRIGIGFLLFLIVLGIFWYKKRKQRLELEAQNKIKQNQLHLSKKIHDVVANGIYRVMTEIEYKEDIDREGVLDKLDDMYQKSRDISHDVEEQTVAEVSYSEKLADLLKSFASDHRRVLIAGNEPDLWTRLNKRAKEEVSHVLQELMVNMKKHSQADQVVIRFENQGNQLEIFYKDNGIGLADSKTYGKGLSNMVSRIEGIGGEIIFVKEERKGLSVKINIPIL